MYKSNKIKNSKKIALFIFVLYSILSKMLIFIEFIYMISFVGVGKSDFVAYTAFQGDKVNVKYVIFKKGFK